MNLVFAIAGILGGLFWVAIRFIPPECVHITLEAEVFCNRLWSPALLGMLLGFIGLALNVRTSLTRLAWGSYVILPVGFALMLLGNFVEYWMLTDLPHQGPGGFARGLAWMTVLFGILIVLIGSASAGVTGLKRGCVPRWLSMLLTLLLPVTIAIGALNLNFVGIPIGITSAGVGVTLLKQKSR
jgi:hypothetical protein